MPAYSPSLIRPVFITGLKNAHALENQALAMIDRQLDRLVHYPELADRLRIHRRETEDQIRRLEEILRDRGDSPSAFKDFALNMMGNFAAMGNVMAGDEVLKNSFATYALENFEIASYISLIAMAEAGAYPTAIPLLETTLREEKAMASWVEERLPDITRQYLGLQTSGVESSH